MTQPHGLNYISKCSGKGFHTHPKEPPLYEVNSNTKHNVFSHCTFTMVVHVDLNIVMLYVMFSYNYIFGTCSCMLTYMYVYVLQGVMNSLLTFSIQSVLFCFFLCFKLLYLSPTCIYSLPIIFFWNNFFCPSWAECVWLFIHALFSHIQLYMCTWLHDAIYMYTVLELNTFHSLII